MAEQYKSYVQQLLQNRSRSRRNYFFEQIHTRLVIPPPMKDVRYRHEPLHVREFTRRLSSIWIFDLLINAFVFFYLAKYGKLH